MAESAVEAPRSPSIARTLENIPMHACNICGDATALQCSTLHTESSSTGGCPLFAFYCSAGCQSQDSETHQQECGQIAARNELFEIARILRECWLMVRQNTWDHDVKSLNVEVEESDGKVLCDMGSGEKFANSTIFHKFEEILLERANNKFGVVRDAVLTAGTSERANACLYKLIEYLLKDVATKIEEVLITPDKPLLTVQENSSNLPPANNPKQYTHFKSETNRWVLKITTPTAKEYALDITGAQSGDDCALYNWNDLVTTEHDHRTFGESHNHMHLDSVLSTPLPSLEIALRELSYSHLSRILTIFFHTVSAQQFAAPLPRENLIEALDNHLKECLSSIDIMRDMEQWVEKNTVQPTPLGSMLGAKFPGVVMKELEIELERDEVETREVEGQGRGENPFQKYLRDGNVNCSIL